MKELRTILIFLIAGFTAQYIDGSLVTVKAGNKRGKMKGREEQLKELYWIKS